MGVPAITGDLGGPYVPPQPTQPPLVGTMISGSVRTFIKGGSVMLFPGATTSIGPIVASTLNSTTTLIEGAPVILGGSVTALASGYSQGVITAVGAVGVLVN